MIDIASGAFEEAEETVTDKRASTAGKKGGPARAASLTPEQRSDIAKVPHRRDGRKRAKPLLRDPKNVVPQRHHGNREAFE